MYTYQDLQENKRTDEKLKMFLSSVINSYKSDSLYITAKIAQDYYRQKNTTITRYQKLQKAGKEALVGGVSYGFYNMGTIEIFSAVEFAPLYDEENGALRAGIRFWQLADDKPLRVTLFEEDGFTDYIQKKNKPLEVMTEKRSYRQIVISDIIDGTRIFNGENYPYFPIVPLFANDNKQSELVGMRAQIDCYDLIKSGFANDLDDASQIYWTLENAGGMDDVDLAKFIERMKIVKAAVIDEDGAKAEAHTIEVPYNARESYLTRLENDLYNDFMALNVSQIAAGNVTATQIQAAYEALNEKTDNYEYCVRSFILQLLKIAGIEDSPTFTRSKIINTTELIQAVLQSAQYLDSEYVTKKIMTLLGDGDMADEVLNSIEKEDMERFTAGNEEAEAEKG